jgi:multidrug efflux system membrane fusion protein
MKRSTYLSLGLLAATGAWMLSGPLMSSVRPPAAPEVAPPDPRMSVSVVTLSAGTVTRRIVVQGQLEPRRQVAVSARTAGRVVELPVDKGATVKRGDVIAVLGKDDRPALVAKAEAQVARRELELEAAQRLRARSMQSEVQLKLARAELASAKADLELARLDLARTQIRAPFDGVLEQRRVEQGSLLESGDEVAQVLDESTLKAVGHVPQVDATALAEGQAVEVMLLDGRSASGRITYIARAADSQTRSFRVEAEIPNPEARLNAGMSAELRIAVGSARAHFISPAMLSLDPSGRVGVKSVADDDIVHFHEAEVVRTQADGVWVSGLPGDVRVIVQGQGFVNAGERVVPVPRRDAPAATQAPGERA